MSCTFSIDIPQTPIFKWAWIFYPRLEMKVLIHSIQISAKQLFSIAYREKCMQILFFFPFSVVKFRNAKCLLFLIWFIYLVGLGCSSSSFPYFIFSLSVGGRTNDITFFQNIPSYCTQLLIFLSLNQMSLFEIILAWTGPQRKQTIYSSTHFTNIVTIIVHVVNIIM